MLVYLVYHVEERERQNLELIAKLMQEKSKCVETKLLHFEKAKSQAIVDKPDVFLMYPIRDEYTDEVMTLLKYICRCKIIVLETEGFMNFDDIEFMKIRIGQNVFSKELIDYFFVWGPRPREVYRKLLIEQNKMRDESRIEYCGYLMYDKVNADSRKVFLDAERYYKSIAEQYNSTILCVTGFPNAEVTIEAMKEMSSFTLDDMGQPLKSEIEMAERKIDVAKRYRDLYISNIVEMANRHKEYVFFVKIHPLELSEKGENYCRYLEAFGDCDNVVLIKKAEMMGPLLKNSNLMIHYGSTSALEAYIYRVPTLLLASLDTDKQSINEDFIESTYRCLINDVKSMADILERRFEFSRNESVESVLNMDFGYDFDMNRCPTDKLISAIFDPNAVGIVSEKCTAEKIKGRYGRVYYKKMATRTISCFARLKFRDSFEYAKVFWKFTRLFVL